MSDQFRVIAYTMHESEQGEARSRLANQVATDGFVIGDADRVTIDDMKARGLVIRELEPAPTAERRAAFRASSAGVHASRGGYVVIRLSEPLCEQHSSEIRGAGLEIRERLGTRTFTAEVLDPAAPGRVEALPYVVSVADYQTDVRRKPKAPPSRARAAAGAGGSRPSVAAAATVVPDVYDVVLHDPATRGAVETHVASKGVVILASGGRKLRVRATPSEAEEINQLDEVSLVEEFVPPKLYNDRARELVWQAAPPAAGLTGRGEIVAVADTGIDVTHAAFAGRTVVAIPRGRPGDPSDTHGHGTHVAGTILGGGGTQEGIAPGASLFFQSVLDANGELGGLPLDLNELFAEAHQAGARIHNDSWGADLNSTYTVSSLEVDNFVHEHRDMLVVIAAGNAGSCLDPATGVRRTSPGFVEWGSIGAPATSKNALVVGASRSDRTNGGFASLTYGAVWGDAFPDRPIADEPISGKPDSLAGFSSRGPCTDNRIKPDVVAPGTSILSARANTAPAANFEEVVGRNGAAYGYMSGTSMAAPVVAGMAALVREYLRTVRNDVEPSAALLKALIINGTRWLTGSDSRAEFPDLPNFHQGFGVVHIPGTIPLDNSYVLAYEDNWKRPGEHLTLPGMRRRYRFKTTRAAELRITMAYTDPPARSVQNDISMIMEMPGGQKRLGNEKVPLGVFFPDPVNNVETIRIENAPAGNYLIQITATTILHPPQDFALVVTGALDKPTLDPA